jgi:hypothetical protein
MRVKGGQEEAHADLGDVIAKTKSVVRQTVICDNRKENMAGSVYYPIIETGIRH